MIVWGCRKPQLVTSAVVHDAIATDAFVPARRAVPYVPLDHPSSAYRGPLYRLSVWPVVGVLFVPALGVAQAAFDDAIELATVKTPA